jgi:O-antigen ligase
MEKISSNKIFEFISYIYIFFVCISYNLEWFYISGSFAYVDLLLPFLFLFTIVTKPSNFDYIAICLFVLSVISCMSSIYSYTILEMHDVNIGYMLRSIYFVLLYLFIFNLSVSTDSIMKIIILSLFFSLMLCIYIWSTNPRYFGFGTLPMLHIQESPSGLAVNRNETGLTASLLFTLSFFGLVNNKYFSRLVLFIIVIIAGLASILSFSKGSWILIILGAFLVLIYKFGPKLLIYIPILVVPFIFIPISSELQIIESIMARLTGSEGTNATRMQYVIDSSLIGADNFFLGIGPGNYNEYSDINGYKASIDPHNAYLQTFAELGLFGLCIVLILYLSAFIQGYINSKSDVSHIIIFTLVIMLMADGLQSGLSLTMKIFYILLALTMREIKNAKG